MIRDKPPSELSSAALNLNLAFAPSDFPHEAIRGGDSSRNPVIRRRVLDPLERCDGNQVVDGIETAEWLLENIRLPGEGKKRTGVAKQIQDALTVAKRRVSFARHTSDAQSDSRPPSGSSDGSSG
jgi:hypothetical protein